MSVIYFTCTVCNCICTVTTRSIMSLSFVYLLMAINAWLTLLLLGLGNSKHFVNLEKTQNVITDQKLHTGSGVIIYSEYFLSFKRQFLTDALSFGEYMYTHGIKPLSVLPALKHLSSSKWKNSSGWFCQSGWPYVKSYGSCASKTPKDDITRPEKDLHKM